MKNLHKYEGPEISYDEVKHFIDPIRMYVNIPIYDMGKIFKKEFIEQILKINKTLFANVPSIDFDESLAGITYNYHEDGYDFRINPVTFINKVYKKAGIDYTIPALNLDSVIEAKLVEDHVKFCVSKVMKSKDYTQILVAEEICHNIKDIMEYYHYDINKLAEKCTIPKNLIFYIAYRNLLSYKETNNSKYLKYPYEYYTYIWGNNAYYWPCHINISGYGDNLHWESFKKDYMHITTKLEDVIKPDIVLPFKLLKSGHVERVLKDTYQRSLASYDQDKAKYYELLRNKIAYFSHTPSIHVIAGEHGYAGYLGFVYENDYLVFEKFYNTTKNPNILNPLTHEEAIYSYPADCLDLFGKDKQYILNEMRTDWRIRRVFHTSDNAFMTKVDEIIALPNHSLTSFDEEIENYKEKILVLR